MRVAIIDFYARTRRSDTRLEQALSATGCYLSYHTGIDELKYKVKEPRSGVQPLCKSAASNQCPASRYMLRRVVYALQYRKCMSNLLETIRLDKPDIVHYKYSPLPYFDRQFVEAIHAWSPVMLTVNEPELSSIEAMRYSGYKEIITQCARLITHTAWARRRLVELGINKRKIDLIPFYARDSSLCVEQRNGSQIAIDVNSSVTSPITILAPGAGKRYADIDVIIKAVKYLPDKLRDRCRFIVVGHSGMRLQSIEDVCREACMEHLFKFNIQMRGECESYEEMHNASVLIFPDRNQLANTTFLNTLSFSSPLIVSRKALYEELLHNGAEAYLVEPGNERSLADALTQVIDKIGSRNPLKMSADFLANRHSVWESIAARTLLSYQRTLESSGVDGSDSQPIFLPNNEHVNEWLTTGVDSVRRPGEVNV